MFGRPAPPASFVVTITPQETVHHAAAKVAGSRLYLVTPPVMADIADQLAAAWESIRTQIRSMQPAEAERLICDTLKACSALPSQWLPRLTIRRVADG
jgi:hypothetical protein